MRGCAGTTPGATTLTALSGAPGLPRGGQQVGRLHGGPRSVGRPEGGAEKTTPVRRVAARAPRLGLRPCPGSRRVRAGDGYAGRAGEARGIPQHGAVGGHGQGPWRHHDPGEAGGPGRRLGWARKVPGQPQFSTNFRVSDASSISDFLFLGDYNDLVATNGLVFGVWTDRRHQTDILEFEDNVFGSLL
jgi:hypothetical protein